MTTKETIIKYCRENGFEHNRDNFNGDLYQFKKYILPTMILSISISDSSFVVGVLAVNNRQIYKANSAPTLTSIIPNEDALMYLWTMSHDAMCEVLDQMTGLGFNTKKTIIYETQLSTATRCSTQQCSSKGVLGESKHRHILDAYHH